jgi:hypothetical protein
MPRSREENARLDRLAGSGEGWGGGLPLPLLFAAFLNELLDNETVSQERFTEIAADVLAFKSNQVMSVWPSWEAFTADVLAQMASKDIVQGTGGKWFRGGKLIPGSYIEVIPARTWQGRKYPRDGVTVWEKDEREFRSRAAHSEREATSLVGNFRPAAPSHVSEIRESEHQVGQLYPVLVDQHGRILDGGHRKAANPGWHERKITVHSEQEALAIGLWANRGQPLAPKVQARITELIGELAGTSQMKRDRVKAALLADPSRSDSDIGREVGCDHKTVTKIKRELQETGEIPRFESKGRGITTGTIITDPKPPVLTEQLQEAINAAYANGTVKTGPDVEAMFNLKRATAWNALSRAKEAARSRVQSPPAQEPMEQSHTHNWGPWIRLRRCAECGEQEVETDE